MTHDDANPESRQQQRFAGMQLISSSEITATTSVTDAVDALESALLAGFDPEQDAARSRVTTTNGELLLMPSTFGEFAGAKLLSSTPDNGSRGLPLIQGAFVLFEGPHQQPAAIVDGIGLTNLRTPAVSALAVRHLARDVGPERVTIFGSGPQARVHALALCALHDVAAVTLVGRDMAALEALAAELVDAGTPAHVHSLDNAAEAVAEADIICTCTAAPAPLFDGALVKDSAVVVAMGSHFPDARETDDTLISRASVVVESRASTLREAGDVLIPLSSGVCQDGDLLTLDDVVAGRAQVSPSRPRLFKFTGMPWQDLVVAAEIYRSLTSAGRSERTR